MTRNEKKSKMVPFWVEDKGLSLFLGFLVFMTVFVPMFGLSRSGRIVIDLIFALIFLSGAVATIRDRVLVYLAIAFTAVEFTADLIVEFDPSLGHWGWDTTLKICGLAILAVMTVGST